MMISLLAQVATAERFHGYPACPPWYFTEGLKCTRDLKPVPWFQQKKWIHEMKHNPEFYEKAMKYLEKSEGAKNGFECFSSCPPFWKGPCDRMCHKLPWYSQQRWIKKMQEDPEFRKQALPYIPMPISEVEENEERTCYESCPPFWKGPCDRMCHDVPWYQQERWVKMMNEDPEFRQQALAYIPMPLEAEEAEENTCYPSCPPFWKGPCDRMCHNVPWYQQERWVKKMKEDPKFRQQALAYIPMPISEVEENKERTCYESCPPFWKGPCDRMCHDVPWYQQERWVKKMEEDPEFKAQALPYIPMPISETEDAEENMACYSACPPWFKFCTMQCMSQPWYKQAKWVQKMKEDPEFKARAQKYLDH